jgi:hypothetical protein
MGLSLFFGKKQAFILAGSAFSPTFATHLF